MFTFLVTQSLRNRMLVLATSLALVIFGAFSMTPAGLFKFREKSWEKL